MFSFLPSFLLFKLRGLDSYPGGTLTHCSCQPSLDAHFPLQVLKSVPKGMKPSSKHAFTAQLKPCPSFESLPNLSRVSEGLMYCPNWPTEKSNLDKSEVQPSLRDSISRWSFSCRGFSP